MELTEHIEQYRKNEKLLSLIDSINDFFEEKYDECIIVKIKLVDSDPDFTPYGEKPTQKILFNISFPASNDWLICNSDESTGIIDYFVEALKNAQNDIESAIKEMHEIAPNIKWATRFK